MKKTNYEQIKNTRLFTDIVLRIFGLNSCRATRATIPKAGEAMKYAQVFEGFSNTLRRSRESLIEEAWLFYPIKKPSVPRRRLTKGRVNTD